MRDLVRRAIAGTTDANGMVSVRFDPQLRDKVWTGSIVVAGAPNPASFSIEVDDLAWGGFTGATPSGAVQTTGSVTVTGIGLAPGTTYQFSFVGHATKIDDAPLVYPTPSAGGIVTAGNDSASELFTNPGAAGFSHTLVPAPLAGQQLVLYTATIAVNDNAADQVWAITGSDGTAFLQLRGVHLQPGFAYYGGYELGSGVSIVWGAGPGPVQGGRAAVTFQTIPAT